MMQSGYEQAGAHGEEMAKLRHDYHNILAAVLFLVKNERIEEAKTVIKDLLKRLDVAEEYPFCGIPVVNAVLTEKCRTCEAEGISRTVNLMIPDKTGIVELDLCMIFGNLMDNAIRACREAHAQGKECEIWLNAGIVQGYLIIKCKNTALENHRSKIRGSGYGHKILADIAAKYAGDFQTLYEKERFMAQISLRLPNMRL